MSISNEGSTNQGSGPQRQQPVTVPGLKARKFAGERIAALTAYDYPSALLCEAAGMDIVLVGDSLANTALGYESTLPVSVEEMLVALRAVRRGLVRPLLVADLPFGSYHTGARDALTVAVRFIQAGAAVVKIEGGARRAGLVNELTANDIPVMGHIGLTPQSVHAMGGYRVQGRTPDAAEALLRDADALQAAGASSLVLEGIPSDLAAQITSRLEIPTIGIGAGPDCDGQILVFADVLGLLPGRKPKFVRQYLDVYTEAVGALTRYREDIQCGEFPAAHESYGALREKKVSQ